MIMFTMMNRIDSVVKLVAVCLLLAIHARAAPLNDMETVVISVLTGDQLEGMDTNNRLYYGVYDCSADRTIVFGPGSSSPSDAPSRLPTSNSTPVPTPKPTPDPTPDPTPLPVPTPVPTPDPTPVPTAEQSLSCPPAGEAMELTFNEGDVLKLAIAVAGGLCTLLEVDSASITSDDAAANLKPVGRSYNGNDWEPYSGSFAATSFDCTGGSASCMVSLLVPSSGRSYVLKPHTYPHTRTEADLHSRFLEKATFGPTRDDIASFNDASQWVSSQFEEPITSHRAFWRDRMTAWHAESNFHTLLHTDACKEGARYRKYAFITTDYERFVSFAQSDVDSSKVIVSVDGIIRTIVDGPVGCGYSSSIDVPNLPMGEYEIVRRPLEGIFGKVHIRGPGGCRDLYFNGVYGNPRVQYNAAILPTTMAVDLNSNTIIPVLSGAFAFDNAPEKDGEEEMLQVTADFSDNACPSGIPGAPETAIFGITTDESGATEYWLHSTTLTFVNNDLDSPIPDGGKSMVTKTKNATDRMQAVCSNVPRTFLNEESCFLAEDACFRQDIDDVSISLDLESLQIIHEATGGAGGADTRYVYAIEGLINEYPLTEYPCTAGTRSRWMKVSDCSGGPLMGSSTTIIFQSLIQNAEDGNALLRDVFFPFNGVSCAANDRDTFNFKVTVGGVCWENVHPDHHQVYDFTYWTENHPGNGPNFNPIEDVAENPNATAGSWSVTTPFVLFYPDWHSMQRWYNNKGNFPSLGKIGDQTSFKALPAELIQESIALAFRADYSLLTVDDGKVVVCGSPFEVASIHGSDARPMAAGGFDMNTDYNTTTSDSTLFEQRRMVWLHLALNANDQLRQRTAWALSQILALSPGSISDDEESESFLSYYDIFVRHAFGNYFDILKEVTYHPLMAEMLTYRNGESTGYVWLEDSLFQKADENYAREVVQLFSIGLYALNRNGTQQFDNEGNEVRTYTNNDLTEYAKVYTGFRRQALRGNIEDPRSPTSSGNNQVDPMLIDSNRKDHFPKLGLGNKYVGDGYPLCLDLPDQHWLKAGSNFRLLGSSPVPDLLTEPDPWFGAAPKRITLNEASQLAAILCNGNVNNCNPTSPNIELSLDVACDGLECDIHEPRTIQVAPGIFYEYVRPACVHQMYYENPQAIRKRSSSDGRWMCGDPRALHAGTACCEINFFNRNGDLQLRDFNSSAEWRYQLFGGERVPLGTAQERCSADKNLPLGLRMCTDPYINDNDCFDSKQGGCDTQNLFWWTANDCSLYVKVNLEGNIAVVHEHNNKANYRNGELKYDSYDNYKMVRYDTKMYFRAKWQDQGVVDTFLGDYNSGCSGRGGFLDTDGLCRFPITVEASQIFQTDADVASIEIILSKASIGTFPPTGMGEPVDGAPEIEKFPAGPLSSATVFKFTDVYGQIQYRKNVMSVVSLGNGNLQMENPVSFFSLPEHTVRDAQYEVDAALKQYFYHPNTAPFIAIRMAQRFGHSNPSPRHIETVATAFHTGVYKNGGTTFGSGQYGCMKATVAAILIDRETVDPTLDADPAQGSVQEPYLKLVRLMRSLEYEPTERYPYARIDANLQEAIGQESHRLPSVFSFFRPEYSAAGKISTSGLVAPETQVLNGPTVISTINAMLSFLKYGLNDCFGGIGDDLDKTDKDGFQSTVCGIGADMNWGAMTYNSSDFGLTSAEDIVDDLATLLTSGRLSAENREILKDAYTFTLEQGKSKTEADINIQQLLVTSPEFHTTQTPSFTGANRTLPSTPPPTGKPYKAIIYLMFAGGADSYNMLVPYECTGVNSEGATVKEQYLEHRGNVAFDQSAGEFDLRIAATGQPCSEFAIHDELDYVQELYNDGEMLWVANAGVVNQNGMNKENFNAKTKTQLFAHNAMQEEGKKVDPYNAFTGTGVLGRAKDVLQGNGHVVNALSIDGSAVVLDGVPGASQPPVVVSSNGVNTFARRSAGDNWRRPFDEYYLPIEDYASQINKATDKYSGLFGDFYSQEFLKGIQDAEQLQGDLSDLNSPLDGAIWGDEPDNAGSLWRSLRTVAKLMKTHQARNTDRDVFFVEYGGFDMHDNMKARLRTNMQGFNYALEAFVKQLKQDNLFDNVAIVQNSDFARTLTPNNNAGTDHAWGQHNMIFGGSLNGGKILGQYPSDISPDGIQADGSGRGRFIPTTSNDAVWNGVLEWFGVETDDGLDYCLPNRHNTVNPFEGTTTFDLLERDEIFKADPPIVMRRGLRAAAAP